MKKIAALILVLSQSNLFSQSLTEAQQAVINAENSFAGLSKSTNTVNAFMSYLSDNTVMFDAHKPVIGKKSWASQKPDSSLLFWWPVFVGVSADGSMGFSTGPWEWSKGRDSAALAFGYYGTIWKKDSEGNWKMGVDLGISFPAAEKSNPSLKASPTGRAITGDNAVIEKGLFANDQAYNSKLNAASGSYIASYFTSDGHLLRTGHKPVSQPSEFKSLGKNDIKYNFSSTGSGVARSNDLGYVYGTASTEVVTDGKSSTVQKPYLRVWKKEGQEWRIVLDVMGR